jgi:hypothetical protein
MHDSSLLPAPPLTGLFRWHQNCFSEGLHPGQALSNEYVLQ